ncbi:hypothetical protein HanPI659440_Chr11g0425741 [Helianthus annuus]|nr:hypothetical protein HanPI659440_Chr11g0425741 [Helianthus annuus]
MEGFGFGLLKHVFETIIQSSWFVSDPYVFQTYLFESTVMFDSWLLSFLSLFFFDFL